MVDLSSKHQLTNWVGSKHQLTNTVCSSFLHHSHNNWLALRETGLTQPPEVFRNVWLTLTSQTTLILIFFSCTLKFYIVCTQWAVKLTKKGSCKLLYVACKLFFTLVWLDLKLIYLNTYKTCVKCQGNGSDSIYAFPITRSGEKKKKQTEVHPALNPELSTLKPGVGQNLALHVLPTAKNSSLQDPAPHPHFLQAEACDINSEFRLLLKIKLFTPIIPSWLTEP